MGVDQPPASPSSIPTGSPLFSQPLNNYRADDIVMPLVDLTLMRRRNLLLILRTDVERRETSFPTESVAAEDVGENRDVIHVLILPQS